MAARIVETDFGTKGSAKRKLQQMARENPMKLTIMMQKYWRAVYENAINAITDMGAVDTGALRQTIRVIQGNMTPIGYRHEVAAINTTDEAVAQAYIVAGGGGIGNPKHGGREVDYAEAVHDGYFVKGQKKIFRRMNKAYKSVGVAKVEKEDFSGWVAGRPFLTEAINRTEPYLAQLINERGNQYEKDFIADNPLSSPYSLPIGPVIPGTTLEVNP